MVFFRDQCYLQCFSSVLSPVLFLLVMDPLLQGLEANRLGPSLHNTYLGAFAHADDIQTITSSRTTLQKQVEFVQNFCADNALTLNLSKCEVLTVSPTKPTQTSPICNLDDQHQLSHVSQQSVWGIGGRGISPPLKPSTKPLPKPDVLFSLLAPLVLSWGN